jgi:molybdenum cofactor synthesis domain-containing protein
MPTAAVIVIGDEILSGKFADENGPFFIRRLRELGTDLRRLVVIGDTLDEIAHEVAWCAERFDVVFTTGGVGPTHDDRTLEGVARAFGEGLHQHPDLIALLEGFGMALNEAALRMVTVPRSAELVQSASSAYPVLKARNVYIFPGVPKLMRRKFDAIADRFVATRVQTVRLRSAQRETEIAAVMGAAQDRWPTVAIGSYPRFDEGPHHVIITLESRDDEALSAAQEQLVSQLGVTIETS